MADGFDISGGLSDGRVWEDVVNFMELEMGDLVTRLPLYHRSPVDF